MKIKDGKVVYEEVECWHCDGSGIETRGKSCPLWGKPVRGKGYPGNKCPHCGAKNRHSHKSIGTYKQTCHICGGKGKKMEDRYSSFPKELWKKLKFKIYKQDRSQTINESLLGIGYVWSTTDYGEHKRYTDEKFIEVVKNHEGMLQTCHIVDKSDNLPDHIGIFTNRNGYSVKPVFEDTHKCVGCGTYLRDAGISLCPTCSGALIS